jgi:hypothetical protein
VWALGSGFADARLLLVERDGLQVIVDSMRTFATSELIQSGGCVVIRAISRHKGPTINFSRCNCTWRCFDLARVLTEFASGCHDALVRSGATDAMMAARVRFPDNSLINSKCELVLEDLRGQPDAKCVLM